MPRLVNDELFGREPDKRAVDPDLIEGGLRSKQFATVVDLLGFGEISGFRSIQNTSFNNNFFIYEDLSIRDSDRFRYVFPNFDFDSDKQVNVYKSILSCLEDTCKDETRKSFYKSPKGKELTTLSEEQEKAEDLLHSDMIGAEVLKLLATICKKNKIGMTIPMDTTKQLTNNG